MDATYKFLLHIAVAALLGGVIGLERGYRAKEAGFRTHFLVALGAAVPLFPLPQCPTIPQTSRHVITL
ncbi:MAG: MgtC/SapB family protein [Bacteroidaceae bacterium]|nr:MgtC/SapB family protein [Bacteroidaceae bacterium]